MREVEACEACTQHRLDQDESIGDAEGRLKDTEPPEREEQAAEGLQREPQVRRARAIEQERRRVEDSEQRCNEGRPDLGCIVEAHDALEVRASVRRRDELRRGVEECRQRRRVVDGHLEAHGRAGAGEKVPALRAVAPVAVRSRRATRESRRTVDEECGPGERGGDRHADGHAAHLGGTGTSARKA